MKAQIISFHCVLRDPLGRVISSSFNHDVLARTPETAPNVVPEADTRAASLGGAQAIPQAINDMHLVMTPQASHFDFHEPLQGLVEGLQGLKKGERRTIYVSAERAYGFYEPDLVMQVPRKKLPHGESLEVGFQVITQANDGECRVFRVIEADASSVTLDGNHPLAGQDLCFDIEATSTREATEEELAQARVTPSSPFLH